METTVATTPDGALVPQIHQQLAAKELLPAEHLLDTGYVDGEVIVQSLDQHGITICGPVPPDTAWQKRAGEGFDLAAFRVDWAAQRVHCPGGQTSSVWQAHHDRHGKPYVQVRFAKAACAACPLRAACTKGVRTGRQLALQPRAQFEALQKARVEQTTAEFKHRYARRAGIEGTISVGVRTGELRRSRYRGQAKTHLQHVLMAVAINLRRLVAWWEEQADGPGPQLHPPRFAVWAAVGQGAGVG